MTHLTFSADSRYLVTNSRDYEILYCACGRVRPSDRVRSRCPRCVCRGRDERQARHVWRVRGVRLGQLAEHPGLGRQGHLAEGHGRHRHQRVRSLGRGVRTLRLLLLLLVLLLLLLLLLLLRVKLR